MTFRTPWMLGLLVVVPALVVGYVRSRRGRARRAVALAAEGLVPTPVASRVKVRRHVPFGLFAAALAVLVVGMARPMATVKTPQREGTVILAIDVSNSMRADDIKPTRMEAAKAAARAFVDRQPTDVQIGVVAFGDGAVIVQTPTKAHPEVLKSIDRLTPEGGTSLGQALVTSLSAIAGKPVRVDLEALASDAAPVDIGYFGGASVVLFSDGEETSQPDPLAIAEVASVAGVRVHTVGVGTERGAVVQIEGFNVATALDPEMLQRVADVTDGSYHEADDAAGLAEISKTIDLRFKIVAKHTEITGLFSVAGLLLLLTGALLSVAWFGRVV